MSSTVPLHCAFRLPSRMPLHIVPLLFFQIPIATSGIRAMGFLMRHHLRTEGSSGVSQRIITQLVKVKQEQLYSTDNHGPLVLFLSEEVRGNKSLQCSSVRPNGIKV